jgi:hypothetical protein
MQADAAATWQQVATVVVVELLIAFALIAWELLTPPRTAAVAPTPHDATTTPTAKRRQAIAGVQLSEPPRAPQAGLDTVGRFMLACLSRVEGEEAAGGAIYARYQRWCAERSPVVAPLTAREFAVEFATRCERVGIRTRRDGGKVWCVDIQLAA